MKTLMPLRPHPLLPSGQTELRDTTLTSSFIVMQLAYQVTSQFFRPQASFSFLRAREGAPDSSSSSAAFSSDLSHLVPLVLLHIPPTSASTPLQQLSCTVLVKNWEPHKIPHSMSRPRDTTGVSYPISHELIHWKSCPLTSSCEMHHWVLRGNYSEF